MSALGFQLTQFILLRLERGGRWRLNRLAEATEQLRVDRVGFSQDTAGSSVLAHASGLDQADLNPGLVQRVEKATLIPAAGFTDYLHRASDLIQALHQRLSSRSVIGHAPECLFPRHVQKRFSHINSDIDFLFLHLVRISCLLDAS